MQHATNTLTSIIEQCGDGICLVDVTRGQERTTPTFGRVDLRHWSIGGLRGVFQCRRRRLGRAVVVWRACDCRGWRRRREERIRYEGIDEPNVREGEQAE